MFERMQQVYGTPQESGPVPLQKWYWFTPQSLYSSPPQQENCRETQIEKKRERESETGSGEKHQHCTCTKAVAVSDLLLNVVQDVFEVQIIVVMLDALPYVLLEQF